MTATVYALQTVLGTTDCQLVADPVHRDPWVPDQASRLLWRRMLTRAAELEVDWASGEEFCSDPPLDLGPITMNRLSPFNAAVRRFGVLDGYRRLASAVVLLAVLSSEAQSRGDSLGAARIRGKYLINRYARHHGDRWRLLPPPVDANGWEDLLAGRGAPTQLLVPVTETVARWYSIAPEPAVSAATYRLERAVAGWTTVTEHATDRTGVSDDCGPASRIATHVTGSPPPPQCPTRTAPPPR
ncbi:hypothetical protein [Mycobacterium gastri]|uniref:Uncharacterized protein n=1 Tax=Mycobacterium gastri TaxID=1777 RepID=A0A1X1UU62_MYCGS|nr:hypothetical protein [Mycobacterium gastri]ETW24213.1 hypothetical protein MGAST_09730 [Mycobacterium gastri 'Wayne']ORV60385.1 hypothetical protein AWC07_18430 [Mycobacterium gastri]